MGDGVPVIDEVVGVDGAYAGGEIPAGCGAIGGCVGGVGGREYAVGPGRPVAVVGAGAVDVDVALLDVVEGAGRGDSVAIGGVAAGVAG